MCGVVCSIWELMTYLDSFRLQFPFCVSLWSEPSVSARCFVVVRFAAEQLSVGSSCFCERCHSAAQLIVAVSVENNVASLCFTFISVVW